MPLVVLFATGLLVASPPADVRLRFVADGAACPDEATFRALVEERLGFSPFSEEGARLLEVSFEPVSEGHAARLSLSSGSGSLGERAIFTTGSCEELAHSVALAASVAIDPGLLLRPIAAPAPASPDARSEGDDAVQRETREPEAPPGRRATVSDEPVPGAPVPAGPAADEPVLNEPTPATRGSPGPGEGSRAPAPGAGGDAARTASIPSLATSPLGALRVESGLGGFASVGAEPAPTIGAELSLGLAWEPASLHVEAAFTLPAAADVGEGASVSGTLLGARVAPCLRAGILGACALGVFGVFLGAGHALPVEATGVAPWAGGGGRLFLDWPIIERLTLRARGDVVVPLLQPLLVDSRTDEPLWQAPPLAATVGLQLLATLP